MSNVIFKNEMYLNADALENVVAYVLRVRFSEMNSTDSPVIWNGKGVLTNTPRSVVNSMRGIKSNFGKCDGKQLHHIIIAVDNDRKTRNQRICAARDISEGVTNLLYKMGYQSIYAVHSDTEEIHAHIIMNSISFDFGNRIPSSGTIVNQINYFVKDNYPDYDWGYNPIYKNTYNY